MNNNAGGRGSGLRPLGPARPKHEIAEAIAAAVALVTAQINGVPVDIRAVVGDNDPLLVIEATVTQLALLLRRTPTLAGPLLAAWGEGIAPYRHTESR